ncbi:hypothetical protein HPB47_007383 [Ixodes persulcatus]|uniref:Uncharacterized protein n=1 Tax=Ixodes persulcatus TaxID=34615 RepID=A0AC60P810_IXOPE|nr:hypothetical protein HPB47_007383 [Ixodes persulcatus]
MNLLLRATWRLEASVEARIALYATNAHEDKQAALFCEISHVAKRPSEGFVVCCGRVHASGGEDDVEGFPVFHREHSRLQDVAGENLADGRACAPEDFQRPFLLVTAEQNGEVVVSF